MRILFSVLILAGATAAADAPADLCETQNCTATMREIVSDFQSKGVIPDSTQPFLSGGVCYHIHPNLKPQDTHHGSLLIENTSHGLVQRSLFSFYAGGDPVGGKSLEEARQVFDLAGSHGAKASIVNGSLQVEYAAPHSTITYWVRSMPTQSQALLLSRWDFGGDGMHFIFCRLNRYWTTNSSR